MIGKSAYANISQAFKSAVVYRYTADRDEDEDLEELENYEIVVKNNDIVVENNAETEGTTPSLASL